MLYLMLCNVKSQESGYFPYIGQMYVCMGNLSQYFLTVFLTSCHCNPQGAQKLYASSDGWELGMSHVLSRAQFSPLMAGVTAHRVCKALIIAVFHCRQPCWSTRLSCNCHAHIVGWSAANHSYCCMARTARGSAAPRSGDSSRPPLHKLRRHIQLHLGMQDAHGICRSVSCCSPKQRRRDVISI